MKVKYLANDTVSAYGYDQNCKGCVQVVEIWKIPRPHTWRHQQGAWHVVDAGYELLIVIVLLSITMFFSVFVGSSCSFCPLNIYTQYILVVSVCVCRERCYKFIYCIVYVCVYERERDRQTDRQTDRLTHQLLWLQCRSSRATCV